MAVLMGLLMARSKDKTMVAMKASSRALVLVVLLADLMVALKVDERVGVKVA